MEQDRYVYYNPNPHYNRVGDCSVRAVTKALGCDWDSAYAGLSVYGFMFKNMPNGNAVWGAYLRRNGFKKFVLDEDMDFCTIERFCVDHPVGTYVVVTDEHVVCVKDGKYYDSWDSGRELVEYYWKKVR